MFSRAIWREGEREFEEVIPDKWIDLEKRLVFWPNTKPKYAKKVLQSCASPSPDWKQFELVKVKISGGNFMHIFE